MTPNIPNMPVKKGSNSLGSCYHILCWMEQREGSEPNMVLPAQIAKSHIPISPPRGSHHIFKDAVILLFVPNSYSAIPTLVLDPCFSSGTSFVWKGVPEVHSQTGVWEHSWQERQNMHPSRLNRNHCHPVTDPKLHRRPGFGGLRDQTVGSDNREWSQIWVMTLGNTWPKRKIRVPQGSLDLESESTC